MEYQRKWFKNAFTNDVNTPNPTCEELGGVDTPRDIAGSDCTLLRETSPPTLDQSTDSPKPTDAPSAAYIPVVGGFIAMMTLASSLW